MPDSDAAKLQRIEAAVEALNKQAYGERDIALAGVFVTLGHDGAVRIERGIVSAEDEPKAKDKKAKPKAKGADGLAPLSEKLIAVLTAYRISALRNELAKHPETAFLALVHALAMDTFFKGSTCTCLEIAPKMAWLSGHAPGIDESVAEKQIAERHAAWGKCMPQEPEALWTFIHGLSDSERMALLAHCVSLTANALQVRGRNAEALAHADQLAREVALDMAAYWQPTAAGYFNRVSKDRIVQAVRDGVSEQAARNITAKKKSDMAEGAEILLSGKGWLLALLRAGSQA